MRKGETKCCRRGFPGQLFRVATAPVLRPGGVARARLSGCEPLSALSLGTNLEDALNLFIHPLSWSQYLPSTCYGAGAMIGAEETAENEIKSLPPCASCCPFPHL